MKIEDHSFLNIARSRSMLMAGTFIQSSAGSCAGQFYLAALVHITFSLAPVNQLHCPGLLLHSNHLQLLPSPPSWQSFMTESWQSMFQVSIRTLQDPSLFSLSSPFLRLLLKESSAYESAHHSNVSNTAHPCPKSASASPSAWCSSRIF